MLKLSKNIKRIVIISIIHSSKVYLNLMREIATTKRYRK